MNRIRVEIDVPGSGFQAHEFEYCPLIRHAADRMCPIGGGKCNFGLTEITPPRTCPLRLAEVPIILKLIKLKKVK